MNIDVNATNFDSCIPWKSNYNLREYWKLVLQTERTLKRIHLVLIEPCVLIQWTVAVSSRTENSSVCVFCCFCFGTWILNYLHEIRRKLLCDFKVFCEWLYWYSNSVVLQLLTWKFSMITFLPAINWKTSRSSLFTKILWNAIKRGCYELLMVVFIWFGKLIWMRMWMRIRAKDFGPKRALKQKTWNNSHFSSELKPYRLNCDVKSICNLT